MTTPGRVSQRPSGWPVLRTPRWMLAGAVVLVAGLTLAAIPHRPSTAERATDLRGMVYDLNVDIESCAGGVTDSITALRAIQSGASRDVTTAVTIANTAAAERASAQLRHDQQVLDAQRALIDQLITSASRSLSAHVPPPSLPS